ncbi:MAG: MlaD family protein [Candidatus Cloacimonetes bacterium]|nr:MlaD family protein [Candidatus Cloacimonadota bacterium]
MVTKAQKTRLGIFLFSGMILLLALGGLVAGNRLMQKKDTYYIAYEDVSINGLQVGGAVKYAGIAIGTVEDINISPEDVGRLIVTISIEHGTPIKSDAAAMLVPVGITGLKQVEIIGGTNEAEMLDPGSYIAPGSSTLDDITGQITSVAEKLELVLVNIGEITSDENQRHISSILTNIDSMVIENRQSVNDIVSSVDSLSVYVTRLSESAYITMDKLNTVLDTTKVAIMLDNINEASENVVALTANANTSVANVNTVVLRSRENIISIIEKLEETLDNLNEFSLQISEDPSLLLRSRKK